MAGVGAGAEGPAARDVGCAPLDSGVALASSSRSPLGTACVMARSGEGTLGLQLHLYCTMLDFMLPL